MIAVLANPLLRRAALAGLVVLLMGGLMTWLRLERDWRQRAEASLAQAMQAVAGRDRAIEALQARMEDLAAQAARRETIVRTIHAQPRTLACVASPAVRALLDGLRADPAAVRGGAAGAAELPPRTAPARR